MFKKIQKFAVDVWSRLKPKRAVNVWSGVMKPQRLRYSLLADNRGTDFVEWLGIIILIFVIVGGMVLNLVNTTVGRAQEVDSWINSL